MNGVQVDYRIAVLPFVVVMCLLASVPACESLQAGGSGSSTNEYVGALRNDAVAIGGETTGWVLKRKGEPDLEVDVARVRTEAESLAGLLVRVRGRMEQRSYVERGKTPVLVVERVDLAK